MKIQKPLIQNKKALGKTIAATFLVLLTSNAIAEVTNYKASGKSASVSSFNVSADGCGYTNVSVYLAESMYKDAPGAPVKPGPSGNVFMSNYNWCAGTGSWGWGELAVQQFGVTGNLGSAQGIGTGQITSYDWWGNATVETVTVNLTFTGEGDLYQGTNRNHYSYGALRMINRSSGSYREAAVTGSISSSTFSITLPSGNDYGSIGSFRNQSLTVDNNR